MPDLKVGDQVKPKELLGNQHFTQPPARYTEASLVKALEENGIKPSFISGCSMGAVVGACYANGMSPDVMLKTAQF